MNIKHSDYCAYCEEKMKEYYIGKYRYVCCSETCSDRQDNRVHKEFYMEQGYHPFVKNGIRIRADYEY